VNAPNTPSSGNRLNEKDLEGLLLDFRELRCSTVSHLAIQEAKTSLLEIQGTLQDQFLTLTIGLLALALSMIQTMVVTVTTDLNTRAVSGILIVLVGVVVSWSLVHSRKTGRKAQLRMVDQKIHCAADARNEYSTLRIVAEENILPTLTETLKNHRITKARHAILKQRANETIEFFTKRISEAEKELKERRAEKTRLETDC